MYRTNVRLVVHETGEYSDRLLVGQELFRTRLQANQSEQCRVQRDGRNAA
jgi:hypothetical protein